MVTMPMFLRVVVLLTATVLVYRSLIWSFDTPLLRGAWRRRKLSYGTKMGLVAVLAFTIRFMRVPPCGGHDAGRFSAPSDSYSLYEAGGGADWNASPNHAACAAQRVCWCAQRRRSYLCGSAW